MSFKVQDYVLAHSRAGSRDKLVLLALARYANDRGVAWPSEARLAAYLDIEERTVVRAIKALRDAGEVEVYRGQGAGRRADRKTNKYVIKMPYCGCPRKDNRHIDHKSARLREFEAAENEAALFGVDVDLDEMPDDDLAEVVDLPRASGDGR